MSITMKDFPNREEWLAARKDLGIGASEVSTVCGHNKYESALQLWEERTGRRQRKENEAMQRGHEREPIIRDRVMQRWGAYFDLQYNEFGMWINSDYPRQFATLDGILIAKKDIPAVNIGGVVIPVKKGERIILEIKSSEPNTIETYLEWRKLPINYKYQAAAQMMCSGIDKHMLVAELGGMFASRPTDERFFFTRRSDVEDVIEEIKESVPKFFSMQESDTAPNQGVDLAQAVIEVKPTLGTIEDNLDELKTLVELCAKRYEGLTFTEDQYKEAKKTRKELTDAVKQINEKRISVSKQWDEPYNAFKAKCDEIIQVIKNVSDPIDEQVKAFEDAEEARKLEDVTACIKGMIDGEYKDVKPLLEASAKNMAEGTHILGVKKNPKWLNKTYRMAAVETDVDNYLRNVRKECETLYNLQDTFGEFYDAIYAEYISSGLSLVNAINKKNDLVEAKKAQLEMKKRQETVTKLKCTGTFKSGIEQPEIKEEPIEEAKPVQEKKIYTKCVEFAHTDISAFNELIKTLVKLGFKFREIKNYQA